MSTRGAGGTAETAQYIRGVPHPLPAGERVLWEGAPDANAMAKHVFHRGVFLIYFGAMLLWWMTTTDDAFASSDFLAGLGVRVGLSAIALAIVEGLARISARTSWYAITNKRLVLKLGMVLPMSINIPFSIVESAGVGQFKDGTGQIVLLLDKAHRLAYVALWPHCRVFRINRPQPILRGLRNATELGTLLASAVADAAAEDDNTRIERASARGQSPEQIGVPQPVGA